ncbi:hypothetical protein [Fimbriiglobus ruber]|uniref:AsmA-like C-terminal domain-containing protein n=1 Tax=Fimbriiglobus ruber TaxID=1908690 RepID=A0A225DFZ6_9BACT|nr:hypothetical protein [Fimbriiglobus ruber]OWK36276.1 hypothetical protein FRUB_08839 [Fimbriiglobus ruber]
MGLLRSWVIRGLILCGLAAAGAAAWVMHDWVSPEKVREAVLAALRERHPDADVSIGSAHVRIFGGISVTDLTLTRKGDPAPYFAAPAAVIYHDKEQLGRGKLAIRKIEIDGATVRLVRRVDGSWAVPDAGPPTPADQPVPTIVVRNATVFLTDQRPNGLPPVKITDIKVTLLNDPIAVLKIDAAGVVAPDLGPPQPGDPPGLAVPFTAAVKYNRATNGIQARLEVADLAFTPDLAPVVARAHPALAEYAAQFSARVKVHVDLATQPDAGNAIKYDLQVDVREGHFENPALPWPVEQLSAVVRVQDGKVTVEKGSAKLGKAAVDIALETRTTNDPPALPPPPSPAAGPGPRRGAARGHPTDMRTLLHLAARSAAPPEDPIKAVEERFEQFTLKVRDIALDDDFFARLPGRAATTAGKVRRMFTPSGAVDVNVKFVRSAGGWRREVDVHPNRLGIVYEKFRYPIKDISGSIKWVATSDGPDEIKIQVTGAGGGRRVEMTGRLGTDGPDPLIDLKIAGTDIPIDDKLFAALPPKYEAALKKLHADARGDFVAEIRQAQDVNLCENTFRIRVYDGTIRYEQFPYALAAVRGRIAIHVSACDAGRPLQPGLPLKKPADTDRVEFHEFEGTHADGRLWISGANDPVPGTRDRKMTLRVQGENCPVDADLRAALKAMKLESTWERFLPRGRITFGADLDIYDRAAAANSGGPTGGPTGDDPPAGVAAVSATLPGEPPFNPATDLKLTMKFKGPTVTPAFFPYDLDDLAGILRYQGGKIDLKDFMARHGTSDLALGEGEIRFADDGEVWANLGRVSVRPFVADETFLAALPEKFRAGVGGLKLRGPIELAVKHMVVKIPAPGAAVPAPGGPRPPAPTPPGPLVARGQAPGPLPAPIPLSEAPPVITVSAPGTLGTAPDAIPAVPGSPLPAVAVPAGGTVADPDPIVYWNAELKFLGAALDAGLEWRDVHGAIAVVGLYEGTHLGAVVGNTWLDRATVTRQPLTGVKFKFHVRPQEPDPAHPGRYAPPVAEFPDIVATLYQGTVGGEARIVLDDSVRYRVWLTAANVRLDDLARANKIGTGAELRGLAQGKLVVENVPDLKTGELVAVGAGQIDVPSGRMYNLPVLLPLLKLLKLQAPDQTAFEEAHATFELRGDRVKVSQLDLIGTAVSLGGSGELDTRGEEVRFEFYTIWSQALKRWLTTPFGDLAALTSGNLFKIEMVKKKNGAMDYIGHMAPVVTEPVRAVAERLRNRFGRPTTPPSPTDPPATARATGSR